MQTIEQKNEILVGQYKSWPEYDLHATNVVANGKNTKFQAIFYKSNLVAVLTKAYHVLPNEDVLKVADEAAFKMGASPYVPKQLSWFSWFDKRKTTGHAISNSDGTRVAAFYMFEDKVDVTGGGDYVQKGFSVSASIDGSSGVRVSPLDVRAVCNNIMMHLYVEKSLQAGVFEKIALNDKELTFALDDLKIAQADGAFGLNKRHVKSLTPELIASGITDIKKKSDNIMRRYKEMVNLKLTVAQAQGLIAKLPKAIIDKLEYINVTKANKITVSDVSEWQVFNDVTEMLTHGNLTYRSTLEHYRNVDAILVRAK